MNAAQSEIFAKAINTVALSLNKPLLYGPNNKPILPTSAYGISRTASKRAGSMKTWIPKRLLSQSQEAMERERIVERSIDLTNNDPHAAGVVDSFATTVIGPGLVPHPILDPDILQISSEETRRIQLQQRNVFLNWSPHADAGQRMSIGEIQFLIMRSMITFGEYVTLVHMIDEPTRPYYLACQVINPLRLKTPADLLNNPGIRDGVELGKYGEPVAYWIKKTEPRRFGGVLPDTSQHFLRIPAKAGHRWKVIHDFIVTEPEQVRGIPYFAPAMKFFRDLNDYLDAELVSNIVTAAFSLFIESGVTDPWNMGANFATFSEQRRGSDGTDQTVRYQEMVPGQIMYGNPGEKPYPIAGQRPGGTFEPFTKVIKKAISLALNMPYPVLFKDVEGTNFAGFRSAMLDAWRVFTHRRIWLGQGFCQKMYTMLMEEAWLRGDLEIEDFYPRMWAFTNAEWRGSPKGDIEPIKAVKADILAIQHGLKTRSEAIAERGGDIRSTFDQLQEEEEMAQARGLSFGGLNVSEPDPEDGGTGGQEEGGENEVD